MKHPYARIGSRHVRVLAYLISCGLVAGCAGTPGKGEEEAGKMKLVVKPHEYETHIPTGKAGKGESDDRFKLYPGSGVVFNESPPAAGAKQGGGNVTLNFEGADIREVVRTVLGDILRENYIVDPRVGGTITLRTAKPIPKAAVLHTLEEVLRMNGTVIVREADGVFRIVPVAAAGKGNATPQVASAGKPLPDGYSIQVVPLEYIGAPDMAKMLEPLAGESSSVRADPVRNLLFLAGTQLQLQHMLETVRMFDVDWISGMSVGLFTLKNIEIKAVVGELEKLFGDKALGPLAGAIRVIPIERLNALLVVTRQAKYLEQARTWVERLDRSGSGGGGGGQRLYVYPVQNGKAETLATLLNDAFAKKISQTKTTVSATLAPGAKPAEIKSTEPTASEKDEKSAASAKIEYGPGEGVSVPQDVRIIADKDNNSLIILAQPADYESIESAIKKLDILPRQVLIEVTIAEITLKDELKYGLEWAIKNGSRISSQLDTGTSGITALVPGFSYSWISKVGDISAMLNALATDSKLKIVSAPHITVSDNQTAHIQVGDRVPTISQTQTVASTTTTTGIISTVEYTETGVLLNVKPRINAGGLVSMDVKQEVSSATPNTSSGIDSPTIQKRVVESSVTVQSGETLVLGGLIREEKGRGSEGLPFLSRIPILGGLFGTEDRTDNRTELIVLITPRVLGDSREAALVTDEYRRRLTDLEDLVRDMDAQRAAARAEAKAAAKARAESEAAAKGHAKESFDAKPPAPKKAKK